MLTDVLHSEQGDRFLSKFNRNAKLLWPEPIEPPTDGGQFSWRAVDELKDGLLSSHRVNSDARSVIASGAWYLLAESPDQLFLTGRLPSDVASALHRSHGEVSATRLAATQGLLADMRKKHPIERLPVPLARMRRHTMSPLGICDLEGRPVVGYFDVHMTDRERERWQQPLLERPGLEHCLLLFTIREGAAYFKVGAYPEIGFVDRTEIGPSAQSGNGLFKADVSDCEQLLQRADVIAQVDQSDEGGRFFQNVSRYTLARWLGDAEELASENGAWLSAGELELLSLKGGLMTNELRTLLSLLVAFA